MKWSGWHGYKCSMILNISILKVTKVSVIDDITLTSHLIKFHFIPPVERWQHVDLTCSSSVDIPVAL